MTGTTFLKSSLSTNNGSVQTFVRNGLHLNSKPVEEVLILEILNFAANTTRTFKLAEYDLALKPLSLWAKYVQNPGGTITMNLLLGTTVVNSLAIPGTNVYTFPYTIIRPKFDVSITSDRAIERLVIFCEQVYILDIVNPQ